MSNIVVWHNKERMKVEIPDFYTDSKIIYIFQLVLWISWARTFENWKAKILHQFASIENLDVARKLIWLKYKSTGKEYALKKWFQISSCKDKWQKSMLQPGSHCEGVFYLSVSCQNVGGNFCWPISPTQQKIAEEWYSGALC